MNANQVSWTGSVSFSMNIYIKKTNTVFTLNILVTISFLANHADQDQSLIRIYTLGISFTLYNKLQMIVKMTCFLLDVDILLGLVASMDAFRGCFSCLAIFSIPDNISPKNEPQCDFQQCGILTSVDSNEPVQPPF